MEVAGVEADLDGTSLVLGADALSRVADLAGVGAKGEAAVAELEDDTVVLVGRYEADAVDAFEQRPCPDLQDAVILLRDDSPVVGELAGGQGGDERAVPDGEVSVVLVGGEAD